MNYSFPFISIYIFSANLFSLLWQQCFWPRTSGKQLPGIKDQTPPQLQKESLLGTIRSCHYRSVFSINLLMKNNNAFEENQSTVKCKTQIINLIYDSYTFNSFFGRKWDWVWQFCFADLSSAKLWRIWSRDGSDRRMGLGIPFMQITTENNLWRNTEVWAGNGCRGSGVPHYFYGYSHL